MSTPSNEAPERIYNWLNSQLSIARHYDGCKYNGKDYAIDYSDPRQPLVRDDILKAELKTGKQRKLNDAEAEKASMLALFDDLIPKAPSIPEPYLGEAK